MMRNLTSALFARRLFAVVSTALVATLTGPVPLHAQSATGTIEGRVQNSTNGMYLNNAKVTVQGTSLEVFTNQYGEYKINDVPAGSVTIKVVFTGLEAQTASVTVTSGQAANQDFRLIATGMTADTSDVVQLDEFVIANQRETNAAAIAANEQRFSPNLKNVVSSDAFGDVTEGNVGEFVKYLPGITVDYVAADVRTISVRGFADNFTAVNVDGGRMASAASGSTIRTFELEQVSINNIARVEVTKVPRPEDPADSLGGSVNLISKTAFEADRRSFKYKTYLSFNSEDVDPFTKTAGPGQDKTYKVLPGFEFNYTNPISDTFGISINGLSSNQFNEQHRSQPTWRFSSTATNTSIVPTAANPVLSSYQLQDGPKNTFRDSIGIKADWKPIPDHVLSLSVSTNYYKSFFGNRNLTWTAGNTDVPNPTTSTSRLAWSDTFTRGIAGRGTVSHGSSFRDKLGSTNAAGLRWRFDRGDTNADAGVNVSRSKTWYRQTSRGQFAGYTVGLQGVSSVNFDGISYPRPGTITALDANGSPIDWANLNNYRLTATGATPVDASDTIYNAFFNVKKSFNPGFPLDLKAGADIRHERRDVRSDNQSWTFLGADGIANTADNNAGQFMDTRYSGQDPSFGFGNIQYPDPYLLWRLYQASPAQFQYNDGTSYLNHVNGSLLFNEWVTAAYLQGSARFMENRLTVLGGVRFEKTEDWGRGPLFLPEMAFIRQPNGTLVRKGDAGAVGSLEERQLTRIERGYKGEKSYDGYYPSLHMTYSLSENLQLRLAYAKTFGRPDLANIVPNTSIDEADVIPPPAGSPPGVISIRNTGLKPYTADNFDLTLEYYFPKGGKFSVGGFKKELKDFFVAVNRPATAADLSELGLDPAYLGWTLQTTLNGTDTAKISGLEFDFQQPLASLGEWGKSFNFSANGTLLHLQGAAESKFDRFIPKSGSVGLTYSKKPFIVMLKWNYRGRQRISTSTISSNAFLYYEERSNLDVNLEYQFSKRLSFFCNARNILNQPQDQQTYAMDDPATSVNEATQKYSYLSRSEEFGIQWALGLKGSF